MTWEGHIKVPESRGSFLGRPLVGVGALGMAPAPHLGAPSGFQKEPWHPGGQDGATPVLTCSGKRSVSQSTSNDKTAFRYPGDL